jgi:hypothetical protein
MNPARRDDLLTQEMGEELVVYDHTSQTAHRLNHSAALVFGAADGTRTETQLSAIIEQELGATNGKELLELALQRLQEANLLQENQGISRGWKSLLAGAGIALLLPVMETLLAPAAAATVSF